MTRIHPALAGLAALVIAGSASAATRTWPGVAPCAGTLQACVDGSANGDRIEIASTTPIAEDISLYDADRTLTSAPGVHARFGPGHWLSITSSAISGDRNVSVSDLGFTDGYVFVNYRGTGTANVELRNLDLAFAASTSANYLRVQAQAGTLNASVYGNRVRGVPSSELAGMITLASYGGTLNADAYYNRVECVTVDLTPGGGIVADYAGAGSGGRVRLHGNEVRGSFAFGAIVASEGLNAAAPVSFTARIYSNVVVGTGVADAMGIRYLVNAGSIDAQTIANTITRVAWGVSAGPYSGAAPSAHIGGLISSNLVRAAVGLFVDAGVASALGNDYNLVNAGSNLATLGAHSITADAHVVSDAEPRLRAGSPAIDAADTTTLGLGVLINGLPVLDGDGLRRIKGASDQADIGAYEFGDVTLAHTADAGSISGHVSTIDDAALDGVADARPIATSNFDFGTASGVAYAPPYGLYYFDARWRLFAEDFTAMPLGAHFDVFAPAPGSGSFVHLSSAANTTSYSTLIDNDATNAQPDAIVLATQNWSAGGAALYNPHAIGVGYASGWFVANLDRAPMQANLGFDIYAQAPSPNAFRVTVNAVDASAGAIMLAHPLLDGVRCARIHVSRLLSAAVLPDYGFDVYYGEGHWHIHPHGGMQIGDPFNVVVDPAQIADCRDRIFADGFD